MNLKDVNLTKRLRWRGTLISSSFLLVICEVQKKHDYKWLRMTTNTGVILLKPSVCIWRENSWYNQSRSTMFSWNSDDTPPGRWASLAQRLMNPVQPYYISHSSQVPYYLGTHCQILLVQLLPLKWSFRKLSLGTQHTWNMKIFKLWHRTTNPFKHLPRVLKAFRIHSTI